MKWLRNDLHMYERGFFTYIALILGTILLLFWSAIGETMHTIVGMTHDEVALTTMNYYAEGIIGCLLRTYSEKGDFMPTGREVTYEQTEQGIVTYILTRPTAFNEKGDFRVTYRNRITGQQVCYYVVFKESDEARLSDFWQDTNGSKSSVGRKKITVERVSRIQ